MNNNLFKKELKVVNIGVEFFAKSLEKQGVKVARVNWRPPAVTDKKTIDLLVRLSSR